MASCEYYIELISAGLDGQLTEEQELELANHLVNCPACREIGVQLVAAHTAFTQMEEIPAPEGFSEGVMNRIRAEEAKKPKAVPLFRRPQFRAVAGLAACAVLCVGLFRGGLGGGMASENATGAMAPSAATSMATAEPRDTAQYSLSDTTGADTECQAPEAPAASEPAMKLNYEARNVQYIRIAWDEPQGGARVVSSAGELAQLLDEVELIDPADTAAYRADYFQNGQLVAVVLGEPSGSIRHELLNVDAESVVVRRMVPEAGTCDMAAWLILAEVDAVFDQGSQLVLELEN